MYMNSRVGTILGCGLMAGLMVMTAAAQESAPPPAPSFVVDQGTHIPLSLINSVSTKHSAEGDRVYLETVFPILANGKIVIPPGSFVSGTITEVKRPGRVKGRGELYLRFDSLTLSNGVTRDFKARVGGVDGRGSEELDRKEGKIIGEGNKSGDAKTIGEIAAAGGSGSAWWLGRRQRISAWVRGLERPPARRPVWRWCCCLAVPMRCWLREAQLKWCWTGRSAFRRRTFRRALRLPPAVFRVALRGPRRA